jgi:hypothetical protein
MKWNDPFNAGTGSALRTSNGFAGGKFLPAVPPRLCSLEQAQFWRIFLSERSPTKFVVEHVLQKIELSLNKLRDFAMPIPAFDSNGVLPPHLGDPRQPGDLSPYPCTIVEICHAFATSNERKEILLGLLQFRSRLHTLGVTVGFQWLDGSFLEDIENLESRAPKDVDVITFYQPTSVGHTYRISTAVREFWDRDMAKRNFKVDHFPVDMGHNPFLTVEMTRYWIGLFTHRRDGVWKGILKIDLNTPAEDSAATDFLSTLNLP